MTKKPHWTRQDPGTPEEMSAFHPFFTTIASGKFLISTISLHVSFDLIKHAAETFCKYRLQACNDLMCSNFIFWILPNKNQTKIILCVLQKLDFPETSAESKTNSAKTQVNRSIRSATLLSAFCKIASGQLSVTASPSVKAYQKCTQSWHHWY